MNQDRCDQTAQADKRLVELHQTQKRIGASVTLVEEHLLRVMRPALSIGAGGKETAELAQAIHRFASG